ncbi:tetratricopeptide repeat protein, partial [Wolbachia endosymbiont of Mansonella ozzardi]|uniref:tetratricopeptide repeat protein n=1 Tax=Wolbachia endosymbiont of Mansonella ozzardi TaxID=137464 RepID=UPI001CE0B1FF
KHYGSNHFQAAKPLINLGIAYGALGDHRKQKESLERALAIQEKHYDSDHFEIAITLVNPSDAYGAPGDHKKQKELFERALFIF